MDAPLPFHSPHLIVSSMYLYTGFWAAVLSFYKKNSSLCTAEGPSLQIKTQSINTLPLRNWRPTSLHLKGMCVICKAALVCVWMIHCRDRCGGLWDEPGLGEAALQRPIRLHKIDSSARNERAKRCQRLWVHVHLLLKAVCVWTLRFFKCALNQQVWATRTIKQAAFSWNGETKEDGIPLRCRLSRSCLTLGLINIVLVSVS